MRTPGCQSISNQMFSINIFDKFHCFQWRVSVHHLDVKLISTPVLYGQYYTVTPRSMTIAEMSKTTGRQRKRTVVYDMCTYQLIDNEIVDDSS